MSRALLLVLFVGLSMATAGCCCQRYGDPYGYPTQVMSAPVSSGCSSCASTPSITTYSQPSPTLAPGR
jgi:hypothetical protein